MKSVSIYDAQSGRIQYVVVVPNADVAKQAPPSGMLIIEEAADPRRQYVIDGALVDRPTMDVALGTDTVPADGATPVTLTGLPSPVDVTIAGPVADSFECTGGTLALTFVQPGNYTVKFSRFPYIDAEVVIHAT